ncbi:ankyrin repeat domain-containing protein 11-like [Panicum miliaceum]|uniref:Ankyrin repeat domain-containing protein 11-like n=1 Tax=Panicum miliaceum TaxID=4540 RepID=A0A3L6TN06_PANMI|nr:ankyrin repeat domain-containing protein 11-like [Panicum miliaceum]
MSRCFPFPPPGYEKTARPDAQLVSNLQQLDKVEHTPALLPLAVPPVPRDCLAHSLIDRPVEVAGS